MGCYAKLNGEISCAHCNCMAGQTNCTTLRLASQLHTVIPSHEKKWSPYMIEINFIPFIFTQNLEEVAPMLQLYFSRWRNLCALVTLVWHQPALPVRGTRSAKKIEAAPVNSIQFYKEKSKKAVRRKEGVIKPKPWFKNLSEVSEWTSFGNRGQHERWTMAQGKSGLGDGVLYTQGASHLSWKSLQSPA